MILLVDDEFHAVTSYIDELRFSGYQVSYHREIEEATNYIIDNISEIELLIIDIVIPPGTIFEESNTKGGLQTGVRFYELIRQISPNIPILILTNVSSLEVTQNFIHKPFCWFLRKENCLPFELVNTITEIFEEIKYKK